MPFPAPELSSVILIHAVTSIHLLRSPFISITITLSCSADIPLVLIMLFTLFIHPKWGLPLGLVPLTLDLVIFYHYYYYYYYSYSLLSSISQLSNNPSSPSHFFLPLSIHVTPHTLFSIMSSPLHSISSLLLPYSKLHLPYCAVSTIFPHITNL